MQFADRLITAIRRVGNPVLVGIDPRPEDLPAGFLDRFAADRAGVAEALREFGCRVVDVVAALAPAVKFQAAFYEAYGPEGVAALHATAHHAIAPLPLLRCEGCRLPVGGLGKGRNRPVSRIKGERNSRLQTERASCAAQRSGARSRP